VPNKIVVGNVIQHSVTPAPYIPRGDPQCTVSAHTSQWNDQPRACIVLVRDISRGSRKRLLQQPVDLPKDSGNLRIFHAPVSRLAIYGVLWILMLAEMYLSRRTHL
jgi:hypothetical protein